jgi:hypothetical protein
MVMPQLPWGRIMYVLGGENNDTTASVLKSHRCLCRRKLHLRLRHCLWWRFSGLQVRHGYRRLEHSGAYGLSMLLSQHREFAGRSCVYRDVLRFDPASDYGARSRRYQPEKGAGPPSCWEAACTRRVDLVGQTCTLDTSLKRPWLACSRGARKLRCCHHQGHMAD